MVTLRRHDARFRWTECREETREHLNYQHRVRMPAGPSSAARGFRRSLARHPSRRTAVFINGAHKRRLRRID